LRLRSTFLQDGFYKFKFPDESEDTGDLITATFEIVPERGNKGTFKAVVRFEMDQFSAVAKEENKILRGIRPKCQATLLLHSDPLVREIAEQDLLVLGSSATSYLMQQREKANGALRLEIDRVIRRIAAEGRW
jgi:hypothetical protein